jgi:hypothetical protein
MDTIDLTTLEVGQTISAYNKPFTCAGKVVIVLESGEEMIWLMSNQDTMISLVPNEEEYILFDVLEEEIEATHESQLFNGKEYEFNYEDAGRVSESAGEALADEDDHFQFSDYESDDGERMRVIVNQNTGDKSSFIGGVISEEDLREI